MKGKAKAVEFENEEYSIHVVGRNVAVTEAMKNYSMEKVFNLERFSNRIIDVTITMDIQKLEHRCDIDIRVNHVKIRSHGVALDMYAAIDDAIEKVSSQIRRYKKRLTEHHAKGIAMVDMNVNVVERYKDELAEINDEIEGETQRRLLEDYCHHVVSTETCPLKTLNMEEAIMRLDLSGDLFLIYRCEEDNHLKVIYRRKDGNFGIIEPES
ncbi:MAG: Ribosome-associated factor Y [Chlamydiae bacterium]|nr:Ribosome-associated factor Y [Chlamydiota bacterium]